MTSRWTRFALMALCAVILGVAPSVTVTAQEELTIEEDEPPAGAPAVKAAADPDEVVAPKAAVPKKASPKAAAPKAAAPKAAAPKAAASIRQVKVLEGAGGLEVQVIGTGRLKPTIMKLDKKLVLDFPGAVYQGTPVILGVPGLGDVRMVRGAQFKPLPNPVARVVVELNAMIGYKEAAGAGKYTLTLATAAVAGPEAEDLNPIKPAPAVSVPPPAESAPMESMAPAIPSATPTAPPPVVAEAPPAGDAAAHAQVLHAMVNDMADRSRLVVTADGVLKYKLSSLDEGRELQLLLYDVGLKWAPPRLAVKDGPISEVKASVLPGSQVRVSIKLRDARPYHIKRDQNQVIVEVDKILEAEAQAEEMAKGGDLLHKVTMNVQNEDLQALVKALAFEAGFDNVVLSRNVTGGVTITLRDIPFAKALNLILAPSNFIWKVERGVLKVGTSDDFDREMEASALSGGGSSSGESDEGGIVTKVFRLKYVSVFEIKEAGYESGVNVSGVGQSNVTVPVVISTEILQAVRSLIVSRKGKVIADGRSNSIVVSDAASNMEKIGKLIRELDVPIPQVLIEARLIQVDKKRLESIGILWTAERATPANPTAIGGPSSINTEIGSYGVRTGWLAPGFNLDAKLDVLQQKGDIQLLLNPRITTLHDRASIVSSVDSYNFKQKTTRTSPLIGEQVIETISAVNVPVELVVRPHVNPDNTVQMEVWITMTAITDMNIGKDIPPNTAQQTARTRLIIRNRETGVIGGLLRDSVDTKENKVPVLGDLPWWLGGGFFRNTRQEKKKTELVLFLTPTIEEGI